MERLQLRKFIRFMIIMDLIMIMILYYSYHYYIVGRHDMSVFVLRDLFGVFLFLILSCFIFFFYIFS